MKGLAKYKREGRNEWPEAHLWAGLGLHGGCGSSRGRFTDHAGWSLVSLLLRHMWIWPVGRQERIQSVSARLKQEMESEIYSRLELIDGP